MQRDARDRHDFWVFSDVGHGVFLSNRGHVRKLVGNAFDRIAGKIKFVRLVEELPRDAWEASLRPGVPPSVAKDEWLECMVEVSVALSQIDIGGERTSGRRARSRVGDFLREIFWRIQELKGTHRLATDT
jgi:hypothetical protein